MVEGQRDLTSGTQTQTLGVPLQAFDPFLLVQESKRVCAGRPLQRSTQTRPVSTRRCAPASRTCSLYQVSLYARSFSFCRDLRFRSEIL